MILDKKFENLFLNVSCRAALSVYQFIGKKNKIAADKAAVDAMRTCLLYTSPSPRDLSTSRMPSSA